MNTRIEDRRATERGTLYTAVYEDGEAAFRVPMEVPASIPDVDATISRTMAAEVARISATRAAEAALRVVHPEGRWTVPPLPSLALTTHVVEAESQAFRVNERGELEVDVVLISSVYGPRVARIVLPVVGDAEADVLAELDRRVVAADEARAQALENAGLIVGEVTV